MVFKRRDKLPLPVRLREALAPQRGWRRAIEYLGHRVRRLPDSPHRIALGLAVGVFACFTPFFGAHFLIAAGLAKLLRANIVASLIGTFAGNPLTFPFIAALSLGLGRRVLGYGASGHDFARLSEAFGQAAGGLWSSLMSLVGRGEPQWGRLEPFVDYVLWPYFVGGLLPGLAAAAASYWLLRPLIAAYQARRRERMLARAHDRLAAEESAADAGDGADYNRGTHAADARPDP
jgi:uncharacterized protein (DUF2062 family)